MQRILSADHGSIHFIALYTALWSVDNISHVAQQETSAAHIVLVSWDYVDRDHNINLVAAMVDIGSLANTELQ